MNSDEQQLAYQDTWLKTINVKMIRKATLHLTQNLLSREDTRTILSQKSETTDTNNIVRFKPCSILQRIQNNWFAQEAI
jgi:hypothetical protein